MNRNYCILTIMLITIGLLSACSLNKSSQVGIPDSSPDEFEQLSVEDVNYTNRTRLGMWVVKFNLDDLTATASQIRNIEYHYNVTLLLPQPEILVNSYNPTLKIIDVDCTIHNALSLDWYDLRLIVYTGDSGTRLLNADDWTEIYDIPVGGSINPFIAYAKDMPNRRFAKNSRLTENLQIFLPEQDAEILVTIDACAPSNCTEPYSVEGFSQDILVDYEDALAGIEVTVKDWQNDVDSVELSCPEILGSQLGDFTQIEPEKWHLEIENVLGAKAGNYSVNIIAKSSNSGEITLHGIEKIAITKSEPITKPQVIYERTGFLRASDIAINGNYAYFTYENMLRIVDISDLNNIQIVSELEFETTINYLYCWDDYIIVRVSGIRKNKLIDVSDPYNPDVMGFLQYRISGQPVIQGDYVYIPSCRDGLVILDISDPNNPKKVAVYQNKTQSSVFCVDVTKDLACVSFCGDGIHILDIQYPSDPQKIGYLEGCISSKIKFAGNYIYSSYYKTVIIIDVTDPREPKKIAEISVTDRITGMTINGNYAFLDIWGKGMIILDITNPENPLVTYSKDVGLYIYDIEVIGDYAFLGCGREGIVILDIKNPFAPEIIYEYNANFYTSRINYKDGMIFTYPGHHSSEVAKLEVWDVSIPENPLLLGSTDMNEQKMTSNVMDISGDYVCMTSGSEIIKLVDISDPANPEMITTFETVGNAYHLELEDDFVYVGVSSSSQCGGGLYIYNISNPTSPYLTGSVQFSTMLCDVCISGNLAYVTAFDLGMKIIDVSDKANPYIIGSCVSDFHAYKIEIADDYTIMAGGKRMDVINIQDPENPYIIASKESRFINGCIYGVEIHGNYAFLIVHKCGYTAEGFYILDMKYPDSPRIVDRIDGKYSDSVIHGNYAYLAAGIDGFKIVKLRD